MRRTAALALTIALAAPSAAAAQSSGYGSSPSGGTPGDGGAKTVASSSSSSSLPFTGMDTLPLVGGGAALLLLGAGLAHGARTKDTR